MARLSLPLLLVLVGCSADMGLATQAGVTAGGAQDISYIRDVIASGYIPARDQYTAEGLFSEHDLPLSGAECTEILCPRAAVTPFTPVDGAGERILMQLGFGTVVNAATYEHRPLDLGVAVDISGSMSGEKLNAVKIALGVMVDQLNDADQMALIAFDDSAEVRRDMSTMDAEGREKMHAAIERLEPRGGTNIEAGLRAAYDQVGTDASDGGVEHRVMLLTDAQPNTGSTSVDSFLGMTSYYADAGIGISVFGVGLDMGTELANAISHTRGGNSFFLADREDIERVFDEEFDFIVSPVAYDLSVEVTPMEGLEFVESYGAPIEGDLHSVEMGAATLFLSSNNGGIGATLAGELPTQPGAKLADVHLSYTTVQGDVENDTLSLTWDGGSVIAGEAVEADDLGVYKMAGLVDEYLGLIGATEFCEGGLVLPAARVQAAAARTHVAELAEQLDDAPLREEVQLLDQLITILDKRQPACASADSYYY